MSTMSVSKSTTGLERKLLALIAGVLALLLVSSGIAEAKVKCYKVKVTVTVTVCNNGKKTVSCNAKHTTKKRVKRTKVVQTKVPVSQPLTNVCSVYAGQDVTIYNTNNKIIDCSGGGNSANGSTNTTGGNSGSGNSNVCSIVAGKNVTITNNGAPIIDCSTKPTATVVVKETGEPVCGVGLIVIERAIKKADGTWTEPKCKVPDVVPSSTTPPVTIVVVVTTPPATTTPPTTTPVTTTAPVTTTTQPPATTTTTIPATTTTTTIPATTTTTVAPGCMNVTLTSSKGLVNEEISPGTFQQSIPAGSTATFTANLVGSAKVLRWERYRSLAGQFQATPFQTYPGGNPLVYTFDSNGLDSGRQRWNAILENGDSSACFVVLWGSKVPAA